MKDDRNFIDSFICWTGFISCSDKRDSVTLPPLYNYCQLFGARFE